MGDWDNGLFDCFSDLKLCLVVYFLPCFSSGLMADKLGMDEPLWGAIKVFIPCYNIFYIWQMRRNTVEKKGIDESAGGTFFALFCCGLCALVQQTKELDVEPLDFIDKVKMGETVERV